MTILIGSLISQEHFVVEIDETGESTLFIFLDSITTLAIGDELGIFDTEGIIDNNGNAGEILVGSGVWTGSLAAYLFGLNKYKSILAIIIGVCISSILVTILTISGAYIFI